MENTYKYIGVTKPWLAINAFAMSIYEDSNGNYYTHEVDNEIIVKFIRLNGLDEDLILIEEDITINIGDQVIYSYLTDKNELAYGKYIDLKNKLLPKLDNEELLPTAKLIISSFFRKHVSTINLVDEANYLMNFRNIKLNFKSKDYIKGETTDKITHLMNYENLLESYKIQDQENFFIFNNDESIPEKNTKNYLYFGDKKIDITVIEKEIITNNDNEWMYNFIFKHYKFPHFQIYINNTSSLFSALLSNESLVDNEITYEALSPTLKENPNLLKEIQLADDYSIWSLIVNIENTLSYEEDNKFINEKNYNNEQQDEFSINRFLSIPEKINSLLVEKNRYE